MRKSKIFYNHQGISIGPAPNTGEHFINSDGEMVDDDVISTGVYNLVMPINMAQSFSYSYDENREAILQLGTKSIVSRPIINYSDIDVSFSWLSHALINEARIGLDVNYPVFDNSLNGDSHYPDNNDVFLLNGLTQRKLGRPSNPPFWPHSGYKDMRNIFLSIGPISEDLVDSDISNVANIAFGNCYLSSYSNQCSVGDFPSCSASFVCENYQISSSGSGIAIPAINSKTRELSYPFHFNLPHQSDESEISLSVLRPGDIHIEISSQDNPSLSSLLDDLDDKSFISYSFGFDLDRNDLKGIGYKMAVDRPIQYPVFCLLSMEIHLDEVAAGSLENELNTSNEYDVSINIKAPDCSNDPIYDIIGKTIQRYEFKRGKFKSLSYNSSIGSSASLSLSFEYEIDQEDLSKGVFMSGLLNVYSDSPIPKY